MPDRPGRLRRLGRRVLLWLAAAVLLWVGLGNPGRRVPRHRADWVTVDGVRLRALRAGHGDTTLVFLHGYGESLMAWRLILDRLARDFRVLAVDLPGHGLSDAPPTGYDYPGQVDLVARLVDQYTRGPVILVGHSMGGQIAAGVALARPDRVRALVLIAPAGHGINSLLTDTSGIASPATAWVASALSFVLPVRDSDWLRDPRGTDPDPGDSVRAMAARRVLQQFDFDAIGGGFRRIDQPVLLLWGRQDPTIPYATGQEIAALLPCRRLVTLLSMHRPHQSLPDTVAWEMERFLRQPACGAPDSLSPPLPQPNTDSVPRFGP